MQPALTLIADPQPERESPPLVDTAELLKCGMNGARALIEQPRARKRKDKLTYDMFDTKEMF